MGPKQRHPYVTVLVLVLPVLWTVTSAMSWQRRPVSGHISRPPYMASVAVPERVPIQYHNSYTGGHFRPTPTPLQDKVDVFGGSATSWVFTLLAMSGVAFGLYYLIDEFGPTPVVTARYLDPDPEVSDLGEGLLKLTALSGVLEKYYLRSREWSVECQKKAVCELHHYYPELRHVTRAVDALLGLKYVCYLLGFPEMTKEDRKVMASFFQAAYKGSQEQECNKDFPLCTESVNELFT